MRDFDIRILLKQTELRKILNDGESKVVEELKLPIAGAIIDMAVINGSLHGFEIKSAVDTLQRLPGQLQAYSKVFDYITIVTEDKHHKKILQILPEWVGVSVCCEKNGSPGIKKIRKAKQNTDKVGFYIAKLLWREEIFSILLEHQIPFKKKDRNWILCELLADNISIPTLSTIVRHKLKNRPVEWKNKITTDCAI